MKYKPLKGLVVAAMLASSLVLAAPQALAAGPEPSVVTVTGYAQQEVAPDTAYVTIGTTSTDADAQQARTKNNLAMNQVTNALKTMGIPAENMKTTGFYMSPNYDMKGQKVTSYTVTNSLEVKLTDLTMVSQVINKAGSLGANQINNVRFTNEHADQIKENLIKEAVHNGQRAAQPQLKPLAASSVPSRNQHFRYEPVVQPRLRRCHESAGRQQDGSRLDTGRSRYQHPQPKRKPDLLSAVSRTATVS